MHVSGVIAPRVSVSIMTYPLILDMKTIFNLTVIASISGGSNIINAIQDEKIRHCAIFPDMQYNIC